MAVTYSRQILYCFPEYIAGYQLHYISPVSYTHLDVYKRQESHRIDHEVKHHKKPTLPLWTKNKNISKQKINNNNNETKLQNKQQFHRINKPVITETTEVKAKRLSRKRQHSCIINTEQTTPDMLLNTCLLYTSRCV